MSSVEAYGLQILLHLVQLELVKQKAQEAGLAVTPADVAAERQRQLEQLFKPSIDLDNAKMTEQQKQQYLQKEYERLIDQFLQTQRIGRPEFEIAIETSAYLRKLAEPGLAQSISEDNLRQAFKIIYGEKVRVRHIEVHDARQLAEVQRLLQSGQTFQSVALERSQNELTRRSGGEVRPFSMAEPMWPAAFKEAAFALKSPGDVSEPIHTGDAIHLIQLVQRIEPSSAVKFEDHREIVRQELYDRLLMVRTRQLREQIRVEALRGMKIENPTLRKQYVDQLEKAQGANGADPDRLRREMELSRDPATRPTTGDSFPPGRPEVARPPATRPSR